jgi:hypothetical protein
MQWIALAAALVVIVLTAGSASWDPVSLALIAALSVISDLTAVETGSRKLKASAAFLGVVLAAVVLGGPPAALIGMLTILVGWLRWREAGHYLLNNVVMFAWFPLLTGLLFHAVATGMSLSSAGAGYYLLAFVAFAFALGLNFVWAAGYQCYLDRSSLRQKYHEAFVPVLASQLFSALLTVVAVYVAVQLGATGIALLALVLVIFQYLVGELLTSQQRSHELHRLATTDDLTGLVNRELFHTRMAYC